MIARSLFARKIIDLNPLQQNNRLIPQVIASSEIQRGAASGSSQNLAAFILLLDHRVATLNTALFS